MNKTLLILALLFFTHSANSNGVMLRLPKIDPCKFRPGSQKCKEQKAEIDSPNNNEGHKNTHPCIAHPRGKICKQLRNRNKKKRQSRWRKPNSPCTVNPRGKNCKKIKTIQRRSRLKSRMELNCDIDSEGYECHSAKKALSDYDVEFGEEN